MTEQNGTYSPEAKLSQEEVEGALLLLAAELGQVETQEALRLRESILPYLPDAVAIALVGSYHQRIIDASRSIIDFQAEIRQRLGEMLAYGAVMFRGGFIAESFEQIDEVLGMVEQARENGEMEYRDLLVYSNLTLIVEAIAKNLQS